MEREFSTKKGPRHSFMGGTEINPRTEEGRKKLQLVCDTHSEGFMVSVKKDGWAAHFDPFPWTKGKIPFKNKLFLHYVQDAIQMCSTNNVFMSAELILPGGACHDVGSIANSLGEYNAASIKRLQILKKAKTLASLERAKGPIDDLIYQLESSQKLKTLVPLFYDLVWKDQFDMPAHKRHEIGTQLTQEYGYEMIPYKHLFTVDEIVAYFESVCKQGEEGVMLRGFTSPYITGSAKNNELIKLKNHLEDDAEVLELLPRVHKKGNHKGEPIIWKGRKLLGKVIALYKGKKIKIKVAGKFEKLAEYWERKDEFEKGWVKFSYLDRNTENKASQENKFLMFRSVESKGPRTV